MEEIDLQFLAAAKLYPNEYVYLYSKYKEFKLPYKKMKVNIKGGYYWITARDGSDNRPRVGAT